MTKDFLLALLFGLISYLLIILIWNDTSYANTILCVSISTFILNQRIQRLEKKLKKLERLLGWSIDE